MGLHLQGGLSLCHVWPGLPRGGAEEPLHSLAQRRSSTMVLIQPALPFLAQEKGAVGAGDGPGAAGSLLLLLKLLKHQALPLKLGQLLSFLLQGETLAENPGLGRPCGTGGRAWGCAGSGRVSSWL